MALKLRKNRSQRPPETCAIGECMALLGGAWTPNVIWHLRAGARRFGELRLDIPPISPKMLTARLRDLEEKGVVSRTVRPTSPPSVEYQLTTVGAELLPALDAIVEIGEKLKRRPPAPRRAPRAKAGTGAAAGAAARSAA